MTGIVLGALLFVPGGAPTLSGTIRGAAEEKLDPNQLTQFTQRVETLIIGVADNYVRASITHKELLEGAIRGLYDEVGLPIPEQIKTGIARANTQVDRIAVLRDARNRLGNHPKLAGCRSFVAAVNGFRYATDPNCCLSSARTHNYASIEQDFGVGLELAGVSGTAWLIYQTEYRIATGVIAPAGYFGRVAKPEAVPSPADFPWRIKRVVPGSPAQKAGLKPGDVITHYNGTKITAENVDRLFSLFAVPRQTFDPRTGQLVQQEFLLTIGHGDEKPVPLTLKTRVYAPETAFGVWRGAEDRWDCMLDRQYKIGYIRLGAIESGLDIRVGEMLADLTRQGCRSLILDLRWCPGGYVDPGTRIAGHFLPDRTVISKMEYTHPDRVAAQSGPVYVPPGSGKYTEIPLVLLVGPETVGGGELIASALRDNNRCVVVGLRSFGRATILSMLEVGMAGVQFRITTGISLRPNGKNRQRLPESGPMDDWGIRPDEGLEVPVTADIVAELRHQAELHSLRLAESRQALPFDDPATDPFRLAALKYLRKKLGPMN
jgi:C-terminal processing protease CtpA/Prc